MEKDIIAQLHELGFSEFEAEVCLALVREPGVTVYRAARMIGKPVPGPGALTPSPSLTVP